MLTLLKKIKAADICPIYKYGSNKDMNNYSTISLILNLKKIFEKNMHPLLLNFIHKHKLISDRQCGFLKEKSTDAVIARLSKLIYNNIKCSKPAIVTYLDYSKAFDTIEHVILLNKLYNMGIRGVCLCLIKSYLQDRRQVVKVNDTKSLPIKTNKG